ncbi:LysM peptidoglycan-binding domain-containing protein [Lachnospiraceae bacterium 62-26]
MKARRAGKRRRKKQLKQLSVQKVIFMLIVCILILGAGILLTDDPVDAHDEEGHKYYTSITVAPGDSLWSIAKRYLDDNYESIYDYIEELKDINDLTSNRIQAGQYLTVSYYEP